MTIETIWVSFADRKKFRGVAIVDVDVDMDLAKRKELSTAVVKRTIEMKCNAGPDTSVQMLRLRCFIECDYKNKLILDEALLEKISEELAQKRKPN